MTLIPTLPAPIVHEIVEAIPTGPWGGPVYSYRDATITCLPGGHVCGLEMSGHPLSGMTFGVAGTITPLIDLWADEGRLPSYMRDARKG